MGETCDWINSTAITDREAYLWLGSLRTVSPSIRQKLLECFDSVKELYTADELTWMALVSDDVIKQETFEEMCLLRNHDALQKLEEQYLKKNCPFLTPADEEYPELLRQIPDPPVTLFYKGNLSLLRMPTLGVVGSRTPSMYGREIVQRFVPTIAAAGVTVVSGLAMGIDTEAHRRAIQAGGKTIGVLGGGIDICYPQRNYQIYEEMCESHLVVSEYPPGTAPIGIQFPLRNRIISGLSLGLLVVEARKRSGTLITADAALDQGRSVYAVPGRLGDPLSEGTNNLIRQGAMCVQYPEEILEDLDIYEEIETKDGKKRKRRKYASKSGQKQKLSPEEKRILEKMSLVPLHIDELLAGSEGNLQDNLSLLLSMEQRGLVRQPMRGYFTRG